MKQIIEISIFCSENGLEWYLSSEIVDGYELQISDPRSTKSSEEIVFWTDKNPTLEGCIDIAMEFIKSKKCQKQNPEHEAVNRNTPERQRISFK